MIGFKTFSERLGINISQMCYEQLRNYPELRPVENLNHSLPTTLSLIHSLHLSLKQKYILPTKLVIEFLSFYYILNGLNNQV